MNVKILKLTVIMIITIVTSLGCGPERQRIAVPDFPPSPKPMKPVKVALVLSSGGFRGVAHIGVLEVLEENNIKIDLIVGSSAGSFIGAFYADDPNAATLKAKLMHAKYDNLIDTSWMNVVQAPFCPTGPVRGRALQKFMLANMRSKNFEDLKIPLVVVTTSLINNQLTILQSGPIIPAVHASSALPPYFAPVILYQDKFVDGGVISPVPVSVARQFNPKMVIAVDISKRPSLTEVRNAFQIAGRAIDISRDELARWQADKADIVIRPDIIGYGAFEDEYSQDFYIAGRRAALEHIDAIKTAFLKINH